MACVARIVISGIESCMYLLPFVVSCPCEKSSLRYDFETNPNAFVLTLLARTLLLRWRRRRCRRRKCRRGSFARRCVSVNTNICEKGGVQTRDTCDKRRTRVSAGSRKAREAERSRQSLPSTPRSLCHKERAAAKRLTKTPTHSTRTERKQKIVRKWSIRDIKG